MPNPPMIDELPAVGPALPKLTLFFPIFFGDFFAIFCFCSPEAGGIARRRRFRSGKSGGGGAKRSPRGWEIAKGKYGNGIEDGKYREFIKCGKYIEYGVCIEYETVLNMGNKLNMGNIKYEEYTEGEKFKI